MIHVKDFRPCEIIWAFWNETLDIDGELYEPIYLGDL